MISVLFLAANPIDTDRLRLDEEIREIDNSLRATRFRDMFDIQQHWAVRVTDLQMLLMRHQPDIVHFAGHGSPTGEITLEGTDGSQRPVSPAALSRLFAILKGNVRCVVLNACYSEQQAQAIGAHIDFVVGMSKAVGDKAAIRFSAAFYQALGYGQNIRTAFELGRSQIDLDELGESDTPQLVADRSDPRESAFDLSDARPVQGSSRVPLVSVTEVHPDGTRVITDIFEHNIADSYRRNS